MTEAAATPKPQKPSIRTETTGIVVDNVSGSAWSFGLPADDPRWAVFAVAGMRYLATETLRKSPADPVAELTARFARVTASAWGDEKPAKAVRQPKVKPDPVEELVEIIHAAKVAAGMTPICRPTADRIAHHRRTRSARLPSLRAG